MNREQFATAINCIDGRAQLPVTNWLRLHGNVEYVDLITEPGVDKSLSQGFPDVIATVKSKTRLSIEAHQPGIIAVAGHHGCVANPVSREEHWEQIKQSVKVVASWGVPVRLVGLWVNEGNSVDLVCDTDERETA